MSPAYCKLKHKANSHLIYKSITRYCSLTGSLMDYKKHKQTSEYFKFLHSGLAAISLAYFYTMIDKINIIDNSFALSIATILFFISLLGNSLFVYLHYSSSKLSLKIAYLYNETSWFYVFVNMACRTAYFAVACVTYYFYSKMAIFTS